MFSHAGRDSRSTSLGLATASGKIADKPEILASGIAGLDQVLPGGGIPRGRLSEITGGRSCGKRAIATALCARELERGGVAAWIDGCGGFYPLLPLEFGLPLARLLVIRPASSLMARDKQRVNAVPRCFIGSRPPKRSCPPVLKAADMLMQAGDAVSLVIVDLPPRVDVSPRLLARLSLAAETSAAAVVFISELSHPRGGRRQAAVAPGGNRSLGTFICLQLAVRRVADNRTSVAIVKSKLGKMAHHATVTLEEPHSARYQTTL